ncbi:MAG: DUF305 domain-containing protein [Gemmatimonadales bacterium]|nr:MAG: DUF305 domain-containing protein [Gemmatimonadales bacterium]
MSSPIWTLSTALVLAGSLVLTSAVEAQERTHTTVQPGAPGEAGRTLSPDDLRPPERDSYTEADVRFMQDMIHHHEQALIMSRMVPERSARHDVRTLAEKIERAQGDEIWAMVRWLQLRGEEVPPLSVELDVPDRDHDHGHEDHGAHHHHHHDHHHPHGDPDDHDPHAHHHGHDHEMMAGMLTDEELAQLEAARGEEFDRLFLEFMIYHHEGAILMVNELFGSPGGARGSDMFEFATHVANDQQDEIARMRAMLADDR